MGVQLMFELQFINSRNEKIKLFGPPFRLTRVEGLGDVGADVQTQKAPYQDGSTLIDVSLEEKPIEIELKITGSTKEELAANRKRLAAIFNPKLGEGTLKYIGQEGIMQIQAVAEGVPFFPDGRENRGPTYQKALIHLRAPNPYWHSPEITEEPAFEGLFQFPFEGEFQMGMQRDERIIFNDGDAPAPINIVFYGPAQTPTIANLTTGEFIRINKRLEENERLIVDTSDDNKSVYFEDENGVQTNVFHWIDLDSTFFKLDIGENEISCLCATSNLSKDFDISYSKLYTAV